MKTVLLSSLLGLGVASVSGCDNNGTSSTSSAESGQKGGCYHQQYYENGKWNDHYVGDCD